MWASDRRDLSGKTLARLWESIATGPTIAPLVGPSFRPFKVGSSGLASIDLVSLFIDFLLLGPAHKEHARV